jgi:hypothetical protein
MPKKKKTTGPTLSDIYNQVAAKANTAGLSISVAETKRVLACFFDVLEDHCSAEAFDFIAKGLKRAGRRRR